jgi:hypothetical protein
MLRKLKSFLPGFARRHGVRRQAGHATIRVLRTDSEIAAAAILLARRSAVSPKEARSRLEALFARGTTTLYVQIGQLTPAGLVLRRSAGTKLVASAGDRHFEAETREPSPNGAYLVERQYRRLGFYEVPPSERAVILVQFERGQEVSFRVEVPAYVEWATVVGNGVLLASEVELPGTGELRYRIGTSQRGKRRGSSP